MQSAMVMKKHMFSNEKGPNNWITFFYIPPEAKEEIKDGKNFAN
jgi:hypothetical protein